MCSPKGSINNVPYRALNLNAANRFILQGNAFGGAVLVVVMVVVIIFWVVSQVLDGAKQKQGAPAEVEVMKGFYLFAPKMQKELRQSRHDYAGEGNELERVHLFGVENFRPFHKVPN